MLSPLAIKLPLYSAEKNTLWMIKMIVLRCWINFSQLLLTYHPLKTAEEYHSNSKTK